MNTVELKDVKELNNQMFELITRHNDKIRTAIKGINKVLPKDSQIDEDCFFEIYTNHIEAFATDGNTRVPGREWSVYWSFPVAGQTKKDFYKGSIDGDYSEAAIHFRLDNFNERLSDNNISGCEFFTLTFCNGVYSDIINISDRGQSKSVRLDYQNDNYSEMSIMKVANYAKIVLSMKRLKEAYDVVNSLSHIK